jgi:hypothetical protein
MMYKTITAAANAKAMPGGMFPTGKTVAQPVFNKFGVQVAVVQVPQFAAADLSGYTAYGVRQAVIDPGTPVAMLGSAIYRTKGNKATGSDGGDD